MRQLRSVFLLIVFVTPGLFSQHSGLNTKPKRAGESCTTGQDLIVQALELLKADSKTPAIADANQLLRRATDLCAESGEAWYYRSLVEAHLNHGPQAGLALRQANLFPSDALRDGLNPFVLATPPSGRAKPGERIRQRWALVIGIGHFADSRIPKLDYTTADATAFRDVLIDPALGGFAPDNVRLLTDSAASLIDIKKGLNWLARNATADDLVVVYIASHGSPRSDDTAGANYIVANDTELNPAHVDPDALYASALAMVDLSNAVATRLRSLRTAVFLDTCYSGGAITAGSKHADSAFSRAAVSKSTLDHISQGTGRVIFTASRDDQESLENSTLQHGYFTYYLVEALRKNASMPLSQIFAYVQQHVSKRVEADYAVYDMHQTPVLSQSADDADFALGVGPAVSASCWIRGRSDDARRRSCLDALGDPVCDAASGGYSFLRWTPVSEPLAVLWRGGAFRSRSSFKRWVRDEFRVLGAKPLLLGALIIFVGARMWISLSGSGVLNQDSSCSAHELSHSSLDNWMYEKMMNFTFSTGEARRVTLVTLTEGTEPLSVINNTCQNRVFLAGLVPALEAQHAAEIVIDQSFSDTSCEDDRINDMFRKALNLVAIPVLVGEKNHKRTDKMQDGDCLVADPRFDFSRQSDGTILQDHIGFGLTRLNSEVRKIPLFWWQFPIKAKTIDVSAGTEVRTWAGLCRSDGIHGATGR